MCPLNVPLHIYTHTCILLSTPSESFSEIALPVQESLRARGHVRFSAAPRCALDFRDGECYLSCCTTGLNGNALPNRGMQELLTSGARRTETLCIPLHV